MALNTPMHKLDLVASSKSTRIGTIKAQSYTLYSKQLSLSRKSLKTLTPYESVCMKKIAFGVGRLLYTPYGFGALFQDKIPPKASSINLMKPDFQ